MSRHVILVDLDGVVADLDASLHEHVTTHFPDAKVLNRSSWVVSERYSGLTEKDYADFFYKEGTFLNLPIIPGAQEGVATLERAGYDIWFCSTPNNSKYCASEKQEWIKEWFPEHVRKLILTKDKTFVRGNYLIDDKPIITGNWHPSWEHVYYADGFFTWDVVDEWLDSVKKKIIYGFY